MHQQLQNYGVEVADVIPIVAFLPLKDLKYDHEVNDESNNEENSI